MAKKSTQKTENGLIGKNHILNLVVRWSEIKPVKAAIESKLAKQIKLDGFRQGKVPADLAKQHLNPNAIIEQVLEKLLPDLFLAAIKKQKEQPITSPEYQVKSAEEGKDWQIEAIYASQPKIDLGNWQKLVKEAAKKAGEEHAKHHHDHDKKDEAHEKEVVLSGIYQALVTQIKPSIPELLVKRETEYEIQRLADELKQHQMTLQDYLNRSQRKAEDLSQELAAAALGRLQLTFILQTIAGEEKITVSDDEIKKQLKNSNEDRRLIDYMREMLTRQKIADRLLEIARK